MDDKMNRTRRFETTIDINATPDEVWRALTDAGELARWFPISATVNPGAGGRIKWGWGESWSDDLKIDVWSPGSRLRLLDERARPYDVEGGRLPEGAAPAATVAIEVTLESIAGRTRVRLVHSGFGQGAAWDDEIEGISTGWEYELRSLRHYLERHRGRDRHVAWAHLATPLPLHDAWARLVSTFAINAPALREGAAYEVSGGGIGPFRGTIILSIPEREFAGTVNELDDALFRLGTYPANGRTGLHLWAAAYGAEHAQTMRTLERQAQGVLDQLFRGSLAGT